MELVAGITSDLESGQYSIYAQWIAWFSILFLLVFGLTHLASTLIIWGLLNIVFALLMTYLEFPICFTCCPIPGKCTQLARIFDGGFFRATLYSIFAIITLCSLAVDFSVGMVICAVFLLFAALLNCLAGFTGEGRSMSHLTPSGA